MRVRRFCSGERKEVFLSHWVTGIDRQPYKPPAHISSSIRAFKVLLTAHLRAMKTYGCWTWMPSYFQPRLWLLLVEWWCYLVPLINDGLGRSSIRLADSLGLCSVLFWPAEARTRSHGSRPQLGLIPSEVNTHRVNMKTWHQERYDMSPAWGFFFSFCKSIDVEAELEAFLGGQYLFCHLNEQWLE